MSGAAAAEEAREGCLFGTVARLQVCVNGDVRERALSSFKVPSP